MSCHREAPFAEAISRVHALLRLLRQRAPRNDGINYHLIFNNIK